MDPTAVFSAVGLKHAGTAWRFRTKREAALLQTLKELYEEGVPPGGYLVCRRMKLIAGTKVTKKQLHDLSLRMPGEIVILADQVDENNEQDLGKCWFCLYDDGSLPTLIDTNSPNDPYEQQDPCFWEFFAQEINRLNLEGVLQAGPDRSFFAFADLLRRHVPMLRNARLGEVIHVVKLSLQRRILGFRGYRLGKYDEEQGYTETTPTNLDSYNRFVGYPYRLEGRGDY